MEKLSSLINELPEELIEKVLEDLEIDDLESILTTNNNKLIRIAKPILYYKINCDLLGREEADKRQRILRERFLKQKDSSFKWDLFNM